MSENLLTMLAFNDQKETLDDAKQVPFRTEALKQYLNTERTLPANKKVIIVGGGIVGLMTAYSLLKLGFQVHIIEARSFGAAASGRNAGAVMTFGRELKELPYCLNALEIWSDLTKEGIETHFAKNGQLMFARTKTEQEKLKSAYQFYKTAGVNVQLLSHKEMLPYAPHLSGDVELGLLCLDDGVAYPFTTVQGLLKKIKEMGGIAQSHSKVTNILVKNGKIEKIETSNGSFEADYYIFTTGPWTSQICNLYGEQVPIRPRRSQIFVTEIVRDQVLKTFCTGNGLYFRQSHAGNIIFGGGGPWEIEGFKVENTVEAIVKQTKRFVQLFPTLKHKKLIRSFAGTVELTPDHFPIMSKSCMLENLFISAGYNGHGFGLSATFGKFMSSYLYDIALNNEIDEKIETLLNELSLARFKKE